MWSENDPPDTSQVKPLRARLVKGQVSLYIDAPTSLDPKYVKDSSGYRGVVRRPRRELITEGCVEIEGHVRRFMGENFSSVK